MAMDIHTAEGGEMNANVTWFKHESIAAQAVATKLQPAGAAEVRRAIKSVDPEDRAALIEGLRALAELGADAGGPYALGAQGILAGLECRPGERVTRQRAAIRALVAYCGAPDSARATADAILAKLRRFERQGRDACACAEEVRLMHTILMNNSPAGRAPGFETIRAALGGVDKVAPTQSDDQSAHHNEESSA
jgi:hypothetical protein